MAVNLSWTARTARTLARNAVQYASVCPPHDIDNLHVHLRGRPRRPPPPPATTIIPPPSRQTQNTHQLTLTNQHTQTGGVVVSPGNTNPICPLHSLPSVTRRLECFLSFPPVPSFSLVRRLEWKERMVSLVSLCAKLPGAIFFLLLLPLLVCVCVCAVWRLFALLGKQTDRHDTASESGSRAVGWLVRLSSRRQDR